MNDSVEGAPIAPFEVYAPLEFRILSDNKNHLTYIEGNEDYGYAIGNEKIAMYNCPSNCDDDSVFYDVKDIDHAELGEIGFVEIHYKNG